MEKQIDFGSLSPISPITQHHNDDSPNSTLREHDATIRQHDDPPHSPISQNIPPHSTIREHDATIRQLGDPPHSPISQNVLSHSTIHDHNATIRQHDDPPHSPISQNVPPHSTIPQHDDSPTSTICSLYFQYYPSEHKEEDWKRCITANNTYLRSKACKKNL